MLRSDATFTSVNVCVLLKTIMDLLFNSKFIL